MTSSIRDWLATGDVRRATVHDHARSHEFDALARAAASLARELGSRPVGDDSVAIIRLANSASDLVAHLGCWAAGFVALPLPATAPRLEHELIGAINPSVVLAPDRASLDVAIEKRALRHTTWRLPGVAIVLLTSGTTGTPKLIPLRHDRFAGKLSVLDAQFPLAPGGRTLSPLSLNFSFGQWAAWLSLFQGGDLVFRPPFSVHAVVECLTSGSVDRFFAVPTMLRILRARQWDEAAQHLRAVRSPRLIITGGEVLGAGLGRAIRDQLPDTGVADVYGLSETATSDLILPADRFDAALGTVGWPTFGVAVKLEAAALPAFLGAGELLLKSPFMFDGYLIPDGTVRASFTADGFFRTGDLARARLDGALEIVGRVKEVINRGGTKLAPASIEAALAMFESIESCAAFGIPDPLLGERAVALVVLRPGSDDSTRRSVLETARDLESYERPDEIRFVSELALGPTGKVTRLASRERLLAADATAHLRETL